MKTSQVKQKPETIWGRGESRVKQFEAGGSTESRVEASPQSQPPPRPPPPSEQQFPQKSQPNNIFSQNLINCLLNTNYALAGGFIPKNAPSIFEYDKLSDVAKTRVQWRSNFQSGSRVLKKVFRTFIIFVQKAFSAFMAHHNISLRFWAGGQRVKNFRFSQISISLW